MQVALYTLVAAVAGAAPGCSGDNTSGGGTAPAAKNDTVTNSPVDVISAGNDTGRAAGDTGKVAHDTASSAPDTAATPQDTATSVIDAATEPADTAATSPDTASTAQDTAATTEDAGSTTAPQDTAIGPIDAGTPTAPDIVIPPIDAAATPQDAGGPAKKVVRFIAIGDTGTGSPTQYKVGKSMGAKCVKDGCDFVLMLGDNFYDTGVTSENDKQFKTKFEDPYKDVNAPFFVTLGNHDYGGGGTGGEFMKKDHYIKYSKKNPKFVLPGPYWHKKVGHLELFSLDSNAMMFSTLFKDLTSDQIKVMKPAIANSTADWKITFSHHPYRSNGPHGNAGCYEGAKIITPLLCGVIPVASGKGVKEAFDDWICGKSNVHFAGHDHSFQWLKKSASSKHCKDVELIVQGAGAKTSKLYTKNTGGLIINPVHYQNANEAGFLYVVIDGDVFTGTYYDPDGKQLYKRSFTK